MIHPGRKAWFSLAFIVGLTRLFCATATVADVQLDRIDNVVRAQIERLETQLADRRWGEAVENLSQLADIADGGLVELAPGRYVDLRRWCQMRLCALPPEALKIYRDRVDPLARQWYENGLKRRDRLLLQKVVDRAFAGSFGDDALLALGDIYLESGKLAAARRNWLRILPPETEAVADGAAFSYPDTDLVAAAVRVRLVLASILEGRPARALAELARLDRLHPEAEGRLGKRRGKYAELLDALLTESEAWPPAADHARWTTFAGNPRRNQTAARAAELGSIVWRHRLDFDDGPTPTFPVLFQPFAGDEPIVLFGTRREIFALRLDDGRPAWGRSAVIYRDALPWTSNFPMRPGQACTMTLFRNRLYARMESSGGSSGASGCLVCLDLSAEGRLMWKIEAEEGWAFEGSPLADDRGVYVAMSRPGLRRQAFAACLEPDTGRFLWRRFVVGAEAIAGYEPPRNLLALADDTIYYNTNLGAVAALRADDGRIEWVSLYPRESTGEFRRTAEPNPCLYDGGLLFAAPADGARILAFDAVSGRLLWQTGADVVGAAALLGATEDHLIAAGERLYWIEINGADRGRAARVWPAEGGQSGRGRGLTTDRAVLWPGRDKLYILDRQTAKPLVAFDLPAPGAADANLLISRGRLLIAAETELIAVEMDGGKESSTKLDNME